MQQILAITGLTWKAAFRFRLFLVIAVLLLVSVVGLPLLIKDDGTARGFTQILLTYTLTVITGLLGLSTLWLACGTLARDIEECQIQVVATKPIARWQIWLGKWLGIVSLNAALLALSGACVYGMLYWRANRLPPAQQKILYEQVLVARGGAKPRSYDAEIDAETDRVLQERMKSTTVDRATLATVRTQVRDEVKSELELVPPDYAHEWQINLGFAKNFLRDKPLQLRVKFNAAEKSATGTYLALWQVGVPNTANIWRTEEPMSLAPDTFHEFQIPPNLFDDRGVLTIIFQNPNDTVLVFPLEDGMEVLYPEGGFALNFARGLGIILCWMALLAALGLTAASFLSFPVAAFFSLAVLLVGLSGGTLEQAVDAGTVVSGNGETGQTGYSMADSVLIPLFKGMLVPIKMVGNFSPIDALSTGRSISWVELGTAFGQIVVLFSGMIAIIGIVLFHRRELATGQGTQ
jgi:hypothetical protein